MHTNIKRLRKRKRDKMEASDDDSDHIPDHRKKNVSKLKEQDVKWTYSGNDILQSIGQNWVPGKSQWNCPVASGKISLSCSKLSTILSVNSPIERIVSRERINPLNGQYWGDDGCCFIKNDDGNNPFVIIDLKEQGSLQLGSYWFRTCYDHRCVEWKVEGSNDLNEEWTHIQSENNNSDWSIIHEIKDGDDNEFYSKFKFTMTGRTLRGNWRMYLITLRLFGTIRRRVYKLPRVEEIESAIPFPKIATKKIIGDPNKIIKLMNEWDDIQHPECKEYNEDIPELSITLKNYQKKGLQWMLDMENNGNAHGIHGGLLCDEMGLGKTVQMIALMLMQRAKKRETNNKAMDRTVIITPLSLIDQWISELNKIAKKGSFKFINYYGSQRNNLKKCDFERADVVLSTVATASKIAGKISHEYDDFEGEWWTKGKGQKLIFKLPDNFFSRIIVDESHEIKNTTSKRSETICSFAQKCKYRWCLTGTPMNNDLPVDFGGMCRFLGMSHSVYIKSFQLTADEQKEATIDYTKPTKEMKNKWLDLDNEHCINKIKVFLKPIMIRRTKDKVLGVDFPEKEEVIIKIKMNNEERVIYHKIMQGAKTQYAEFKRGRSVMARYMHLMRMLLKLRKLCNHPCLVFNGMEVAISSDQIMDFATNTDVLAKLPEAMIRRINESESLLDYECPICFELTELSGGVISRCGHIFCLECLLELIENKPECGLCRGRFTKSNILKIEYVLKSKRLDERHKAEYEEYKVNGLNNGSGDIDDDDNKNDDLKLDQYDEFVKKYSEISCVTSKTQALIDRLDVIKRDYPGDKAICFSNFAPFFKIISDKLNKEKIHHLKFDATLNRKKRAKVLEQFKSSKDCRLLLISAKCASVGLNLMCANHVIFLDPRINPGLDNQAIGRCWRIGQNKKVFVTRIITENTIEEKLLSLQQDKEENNPNDAHKSNSNLKRKGTLTENDYDFIFDYTPPEVEDAGANGHENE